MSDMDRGAMEDRLADWVAGRLDDAEAERIRARVAEDDDLRHHAELLRTLAHGRPAAPENLERRIRRAVRADRAAHGSPSETTRRRRADAGRSRRRTAWWVAAAAGLVLAMGTSLVLDGPEGEASDPFQVAVEGAPSPWMAEDGRVAGGPVWDDLSDEALENLLQELGG